MFFKKKKGKLEKIKQSDGNPKDQDQKTKKPKNIFQKMKFLFSRIGKIIKYTSWILVGLFIIAIILIFTGNKPYDLGVKSDANSANRFEEKLKSIEIEGTSQDISFNMTDEEITSYANLKAENPKISDTQIMFSKDEIELSALVKKAISSHDIALKGKVKITLEDNKPKLTIKSITLGRLPIFVGPLKSFFEDIINQQIKMPEVEGYIVEITKITTENGRATIDFKVTKTQ